MESTEVKSPIQAIDRAVSLLDRVATAGPAGLSLSSLTASVGLRASTGRTILAALIAHGLVAQVDGTRAYVLGPRFFELNRAFSLHHDLGAIASPVMRELWTETAETVHLAVLQAGKRVDISVLVSPQLLNINPLARFAEPFSADPIVHTAAGKVLLAGAPASEQESLLRGLRDADPKTVRAMLDQTRRDGFATNLEEEMSGVCGIAALCIGYPAVRQNAAYEEKLRTATIRAAAELTRLLGGIADA